jgi:hypothetical protein
MMYLTKKVKSFFVKINAQLKDIIKFLTTSALLYTKSIASTQKI